MSKSFLILLDLLLVGSLVLGGCSSTRDTAVAPVTTQTTNTTTPPPITPATPPPSPNQIVTLPRTPSPTYVPTPSEITIPTATPTITSTDTLPPAPTKIPTATPIILVKVVDYYDDLFDINNLPTTDQPYLDILFVEVWSNVTDATDYVCRITLNGDMPTETPDSQLFYEWDIYIDADENSATGEPGPLVTNDLGSDYVVRFCVLDNICYSEVRNLITGYSEKLENNVTNNEILLRWPKSFFPTDSFYFVVTAKKYGERGQGNTFILGDEAPNLGHAVFPPI